jgi:hypothetical protein
LKPSLGDLDPDCEFFKLMLFLDTFLSLREQSEQNLIDGSSTTSS